MFWRKKEPPPSVEVEASATDTTDLDLALEGAAGILRARARYPFSLGDEDPSVVAETFERWAAHLLVRSPPPGCFDQVGTPKRDWRGVVEFVLSRAKREQDWANGSVRDLRDAMFALIESLSQTSGAQGKYDSVLKRRLVSLNAAVESGSLEALKHEARRVAAAVTAVLEDQKRLADSQAAMLRAQLASVGQELEATRREGETDPLTRLSNRRVFDTCLRRGLTLANVLQRPISLLMVDVDHFKSVNDTHGHPNGDLVLKQVADAITRCFPRRSDLVVRYGGEEFAVVCDGGGDAVRMLATRLLDTVRELPIELDQKSVPITVSIGIAEAVPNELPERLVSRADRALYEAKHAGRDRFVIAKP